MALAATIEVNDGTLTPTGIMVTVLPGADPTIPVELWRAPDAAGAPNGAQAVLVVAQVVPPDGIHYVDKLATNGVIWWYRTRLNGNAWGPGPYSDWVNLGVADRLSATVQRNVSDAAAAKTSQAWKQQTARMGPQVQNILPNSGFEDGLAFWFQQAGAASAINTPANANGGNWYLRLTSTTGVAAQVTPGDDVGKSRYFEVNQNDLVQFGGWIYRESGTANVRYTLEATDKDKGAPVTVSTPNQNTAGWVFVQGQYLVPAGKKFVRLIAEIDATGTGTVARFDDAYLRIGLGALYDVPPPNSLYALRFSTGVADPDTVDGMQSFIDFPATSFFMRLGQTPKLVEAASTSGGLINIKITGHGYATGDSVVIHGHLGVTAANSPAGTPWTITVVDADNFTLNGSTFAGTDTPNTGHCVRLSLTIDSLGRLVVYAIIRAVSLLVSGLATFNGQLLALGGALFRTLQHSVTGNYGDTSMNRVMLQNNNVEVWGDAGTGTNNLAALLGSHTSPAGIVLTARSSKDVGLTAGSKGWTDPDGADNGINTLTQNVNTSGDVIAASRLWCKLGDPTNEGDNVDAYDDKYTVTFRVGAKVNGGGSIERDCTATVYVEYSINSGTSWTQAPGSWSVDSTTTTEVLATYSPVIVVTDAPTHVWFRLRLNVQVAGFSTDPSGTGRVLCFAASYRTDNYAVTWTSSSAAGKARRGLRLPATSDGTDQQPHAYLEPLTGLTPEANAAEGELEYVGDPNHSLYVHDSTYFSALARTIHQDANQSTTSITEVSLSSKSIKLNTLGVNKRALIIELQGQVAGGTSGTVKIKLGNTVFMTHTITVATGTLWFVRCILTRTTGASVQVANSIKSLGNNNTGVNMFHERATGTENLGADLLLDIRGLVVGACTLTLDTVQVMVL